jgi:hypothetical protein
VKTNVVFDGILVSSYGVQCGADEQELMKIANELFDTALFASPKKNWDSYQGKTVLNLSFDPLP